MRAKQNAKYHLAVQSSYESLFPPHDESNEDTVLIAALKQGSEKAFELLWKLFYKRLLFFCRRYVPEQDAQDITTETFVQVWNRREGFDSKAKIASFLFVTARHRCYNVIRDRQIHESHAERIAELTKDDTATIFNNDTLVELLQIIAGHLNLLPEKTRQVFLMSFEQGLKPGEIAEKLGLSVKTVKNQKHSAIRLLRSILQHHQLEIFVLVIIELQKYFPKR